MMLSLCDEFFWFALQIIDFHQRSTFCLTFIRKLVSNTCQTDLALRIHLYSYFMAHGRNFNYCIVCVGYIFHLDYILVDLFSTLIQQI